MQTRTVSLENGSKYIQQYKFVVGRAWIDLVELKKATLLIDPGVKEYMRKSALENSAYSNLAPFLETNSKPIYKDRVAAQAEILKQLGEFSYKENTKKKKVKTPKIPVNLKKVESDIWALPELTGKPRGVNKWTYVYKNLTIQQCRALVYLYKNGSSSARRLADSAGYASQSGQSYLKGVLLKKKLMVKVSTYWKTKMSVYNCTRKGNMMAQEIIKNNLLNK